jgi:dynein heavy chain
MEISEMEKNMAKMLDAAGLFEVNVPDFKQLKQCRKEIKLLKTLWDYVVMVRSSFDDWKTTPWKEINVEQMDMDCKKFAKDIRSLDKEMRAWDSTMNEPFLWFDIISHNLYLGGSHKLLPMALSNSWIL